MRESGPSELFWLAAFGALNAFYFSHNWFWGFLSPINAIWTGLQGLLALICLIAVLTRLRIRGRLLLGLAGMGLLVGGATWLGWRWIDPEQADLIRYDRRFWAIAPLEEEALGPWRALRPESPTAEREQALRHAAVGYQRFLEALEGIRPTTPRLARAHQQYLDGAARRRDGFERLALARNPVARKTAHDLERHGADHIRNAIGRIRGLHWDHRDGSRTLRYSTRTVYQRE